MHNQLLVPPTLRIGFKKRSDTYTGRLAYVTYLDHSGTHRKAASWQSWRDASIPDLTLPNSPTEGFVINRGGGGRGRSWDSRNAFIRVWDPRDFEIEITPANLLHILAHCDCSRGKGIEGPLLYAWSGTQLVLLPTASPEYAASLQYTSLQNTQPIKLKDLQPGTIYLTKSNYQKTFLGRLPWYQIATSNTPHALIPNDPIFYCHTNKYFSRTKNLKNLSTPIPGDQTTLATLLTTYYNSPHGSPVSSIQLVPNQRLKINHHPTRHETFCIQDSENVFTFYRHYTWDNKIEKQERIGTLTLTPDTGLLFWDTSGALFWEDSIYHSYLRANRICKLNPSDIIPSTEQDIQITLQSGQIYVFDLYANLIPLKKES